MFLNYKDGTIKPTASENIENAFAIVENYFKLLLCYSSGRMGNTKQALQLITYELGDVTGAIDFCKEHNDQELWEDLIDYSIDKPCMYIDKCRRTFVDIK